MRRRLLLLRGPWRGRLVRRFSQVAQALTPDEGSAAWQQRSDWLQADMVALAHERIWSADAQEMSARLLLVLFASADACDATLREKVRLGEASR